MKTTLGKLEAQDQVSLDGGKTWMTVLKTVVTGEGMGLGVTFVTVVHVGMQDDEVLIR